MSNENKRKLVAVCVRVVVDIAEACPETDERIREAFVGALNDRTWRKVPTAIADSGEEIFVHEARLLAGVLPGNEHRRTHMSNENKRPRGVLFWAAVDVERWIAEETRVDTDDKRTPSEKARWFVAAKCAAGALDWNRREIIEAFYDGIPPTTSKTVTAWVQDQHELFMVHRDVDVPVDRAHKNADEAIKESLAAFWGG